jgi:hypothetical protein
MQRQITALHLLTMYGILHYTELGRSFIVLECCPASPGEHVNSMENLAWN